MPKYLLLNGETDFPQDWILPEETNTEHLQANLHRAMSTGILLTIPIEVGRRGVTTRTTLLLNPRKLASAAVVELVDKTSSGLPEMDSWVPSIAASDQFDKTDHDSR